MVRVNCEAVVTLTGMFIPPMIERGRGGVITVASTAGMQPLPYEATYGASKAFALNFSDALHAELKGTGVKVLSVNPGPVPTEWQQVAGYDEAGGEMMPGAIEADQVVREGLRAYEQRQALDGPGPLLPQLHARERRDPEGASSSRHRSGCTARRSSCGAGAQAAARSCTCAWCSSVSMIARSDWAAIRSLGRRRL